jgi:integrase
VARKKTNVRERGSSYVAYIRVGGKQRWKSFPKTPSGREAAELWLAQRRAEKLSGTYREPSTILFSDFASDWLGSHPSIDPRTRVLYEQRVRDYLDPVLGDLRLGEITGRHVRQVKDRASAAGRAGWTQKGILALLSGILSYAVDQEHISHNPVSSLSKRDRPKSKEGGRGPKRILTAEELRALLKTVGPKYRPLFAVAAFAGLRLSEVLALVWGDVDFDQGFIRVSKQLSVPNRFDPHPAHRVDLKSDSDEGCERQVFLDDNLARLLKDHRRDRIPRADEFIFITANGTPYSQRNISRAFVTAVADAGIKWNSKAEKPTFHSLRHGFASAVIAGGADQGHVARLLGHSDPGFTYRVYIHEFDKQAKQEQSKKALSVAYAGVLG